jgi:hypothetical protein
MLLVILGGVLPISAYATLPATPEDVLCNSTEILVGDVLEGASADCRLRYTQWCSPHDLGYLTVRVIKLLAVADDTTPLNPTQIVRMRVRIQAPNDRPLGNDDVDSQFRGRRLLLSVSLPRKGIQEDVYGEIWAPDQRAWIEQTVRNRNGARCPKPVPR